VIKIITKENFKQKIFDFASEKYKEKINEFQEMFFDDFPYNNEGLEEDLQFKNFVDWLIIEKQLPEMGKTIVEEFVAENPDLPIELEQCLLRMKNVVSGTFKVQYILGLDLMIRALGTGKEYKVKLYSKNPNIEKGDLIEGRIHEFDEQYRTCGALKINKQSPYNFIANTDSLMEMYDRNRIKEIEDNILHESKKITAMLNNYPFQWIDGICNLFGLDIKERKDEKVKLIANKLLLDLPNIVKNLSEKPKGVLRLILDEGGFTKYSKLKNYDDEMDFWWNEHGAPKSTIGSLRAQALLFVGKMPFGGKMFKVVLIPKELRDQLKSLLN